MRKVKKYLSIFTFFMFLLESVVLQSFSSFAYAASSSSLPTGWTNKDIGLVSLSGSSVYSDKTYTLKGAGTDINGTADAFQYAYTQVTGDCTIIANVASLQNTNSSAKAGIMIRESTASNSKNAFVAVTPTSGIYFQWRSLTGGTTSNSKASGSAPMYVKLVRQGNDFSAYVANDRVNWTQIGSTNTISMNSSVLIGLAVTAHANRKLTTATFNNVSLTVPDKTAPTAPTNLKLDSKTMTSLSVSWTAATDNVGVTGYDIYRDGSLVGSTTSQTSYTIENLGIGSTYNITVKAKDATGNVSAASSVLAAQTAVDTEPPTAPTNLKLDSKTMTSLSVSWTAATDNVGVIGYDIYKDGSLVGTTTTSQTSYTIENLTSGTTYNISVKARDAAGNVSTASNVLEAQTEGAIKSPTAPANLYAPVVGGTTVKLAWDASISNSDFIVYYIYWNGIEIGKTLDTYYTCSDLTQNTSYSFTVLAVDLEGNESAGSTIQVTTGFDDFADTYQEAFHMPIGQWHGGRINYASDEDWFKITPTVTADYIIRLRGTADINAKLYDENMGNIDYRLNNCNDSGFQISASLKAGETYYLSVSGSPSTESSPAGIYEMFVTQDMAPIDLYAAADGFSSISLTWYSPIFTMGSVTYDIYCNGEQIQSTPYNSCEAWQGIEPNVSYSFIVKAKDQDGNVLAESNEVQVTIPVDDYGSTTQDAFQMPIGQWVDGKIEVLFDQDYFKITPTVTGKYTIKSRGTLRPEGELCDEHLGDVACDIEHFYDGNFQIVANFEAGKTYILTIKASDPSNDPNLSTGSYGVIVTESDPVITAAGKTVSAESEGKTIDSIWNRRLKNI